MLLEDDAEVERTLLDELNEIGLELGLLMLVEDAKARLEDGVGKADAIFAVELDLDEAEDGEAEELPTILLLLLILVEVLLLDLVELLLFLLDVLVPLVLVLILVSDVLNELDVVEVTSLVTFLLAVNLIASSHRVLSNILS